MQRISVFDMLKIGVGPSSSHTMGPWRSARRFLNELPPEADVSAIQVDLYGSLAKTGKGHGTDVAVQLGLCGEDPETILPDTIARKLDQIAVSRSIHLPGRNSVPFRPDRDIRFCVDQQLPFHPNALQFTATFANGNQHRAVFFSLGGGFIVRENEPPEQNPITIAYPIENAADLQRHCDSEGYRISEIVMRNELAWRDKDSVIARLTEIRDAMVASVFRGCQTEGILPGGLNVTRRAARLARGLGDMPPDLSQTEWVAAIGRQGHEFKTVLDWVSCFALAVNEENAAFGRIVTAPTNGAAGVIPAVLLYCQCFCNPPPDFHVNFLLTAGEIGCLFKKGATISAAMGGCQAEIGVSSSMAAAALAECMGGTVAQSCEAAEIAMEHHLGMTCDPIGGLVQIPCIERNAMGAIKAITASQMALQRDPNEARVTLDAVIRTMWETAQDMHAKYKETSEGGLAVQIPVNVSEC